MKNIKPLIIIVVILIAVLVAFIYGNGQYKIYKEELSGTETTLGENVTVVIPEGASTKKIAEILKDKELIHFPSAFVKRVKESPYRGNLQPGEYTLNTGMSTWDMIETMGTLPTGDRELLGALTIPEGFTIEQIAARVEAQGYFTAEEFTSACKETYSYDFLDSVPAGANVNYRLQGFLFPATYNIYADTTPQDLINMMLTKFDDVYNGELSAQADNMGYSPYEVLIRASMIEREAKLDEERPIIAGVINNRLKEGMKLQIDPTALYPLTNGLYDKSDVTYDDIAIDSPYNTSVYEGLPVGPICNPGEPSIRAVLYPAEHNYLYYHVDDPETGSHIFTETFDEHLQTQ